ncbi:hypothetical protein AGMMS49545_10350 [Betaproteobacteria bacterium]|nr:hypothetical protein AGMMS49545_10350 [Betaproteobacteria bacterium]GHU44346.1 hypothetical protein AGMMS50289_12430 [Betaproteobacteria bacterium]
MLRDVVNAAEPFEKAKGKAADFDVYIRAVQKAGALSAEKVKFLKGEPQ